MRHTQGKHIISPEVNRMGRHKKRLIISKPVARIIDIISLLLDCHPAGYLVLSVYTYIVTIIKGEFRLTYSSFGPTEFRLVIILINTICMYTPWADIYVDVYGQHLGVYDIVGLAIAVFLFVAYFIQFSKDRKILSEQDPLKPYKKQ